MEDSIIKILTTSFGAGGILSVVLWIIADRFIKETIKQMSLRIDALEKASADCADDRRLLHEELIDIFKKVAFVYRKSKHKEEEEETKDHE